MKLTSEEYERIKAWNREHPDQHYGTLTRRKQRDIEEGKSRPVIVTLLAGLGMSIWYLVGVIVTVVVVLVVIWLLTKSGPNCAYNNPELHPPVTDVNKRSAGEGPKWRASVPPSYRYRYAFSA